MHIKNYLARIGVDRNIKNSLEDLSHVQENHVTHVPFENLDIIQGISLSFDPNHLYIYIKKW